MIGLIATTLALLVSTLVLASTTWAQTSDPTCNAAAQERKLDGAAKISNIKKYVKEDVGK